MIFNCEVSARRGGLGIEWCEARATQEWLGHQCGKGLIYCGIWLCLMALIAVMQKHSAMWFLLPISCFAAVKPVHWLAWRISGTPRAIYFKRSGAIESPDGLFGVSKVVGPWKTV